MTYDLAIIGGGPAGVAAGVYAARKQLKTLFLTKEWGGQSTVSPEIQNWIGTVKVGGIEFADMLKAHLEAYKGDVVDIKEGEEVKKISNVQLSIINGENKKGFSIETDSGTYEAKAILITTGSHRRKLEATGADKFEHNGVTYCASCDGPIFAGMDVAVVGGGNAGFETAAQLLAYCKSVVLLNRGMEFKADPVTVKKVLENPKMHAVLGVDIVEVQGDKTVTGIVYFDRETKEKKELPVQGIFVEIGSSPSTEFVKSVIELDQYSQIVVDPRTQRARLVGNSDFSGGIWAAGDVTDGKYHQNNIAAGDAVKALEDIYLYLHTGR